MCCLSVASLGGAYEAQIIKAMALLIHTFKHFGVHVVASGQQPVLRGARARVTVARLDKVGLHASLTIVALKGFLASAGEARHCHRVRVHGMCQADGARALSSCVRVYCACCASEVGAAQAVPG